MTHKQLQLLAIARRQVALPEEQYRLLLRNCGGCQSARDLSNPGLERVMAVLEEMGFRQAGQAETYWRDKARVLARKTAHLIEQLAAAVGYELGGFVARMTSRRTTDPMVLTGDEAQKIIEALKAIAMRGRIDLTGIEGLDYRERLCWPPAKDLHEEVPF